MDRTKRLTQDAFVIWGTNVRYAGVAIAAALAGLSACKSDEVTAPCSVDGECLPTFICEQGQCISGARDGGFSQSTIGPGGGRFCGIDGVCLDVPAGALGRQVEFRISRASAGLNAGPGLLLLTRGYRIEPEDTVFAIEATASIPVDPSLGVPSDELKVWRAMQSTGPWAELDGTATGTIAIGKTGTLGLFASIIEESKIDAGIEDTGFIDSGLHPDAFIDVGFRDSGPRTDGSSQIDSGLSSDVMELPDVGGNAGDVPALPDIGGGGGGGADSGVAGGLPDIGGGGGGLPDIGGGGGGLPDIGGGGGLPDIGGGGGGLPDIGGGGGLPDIGGGGGLPDIGGGGGLPDIGGGGGLPDVSGGGGLPDIGGGGGLPDIGGGGALPDIGGGGNLPDIGGGGNLPDIGGGSGLPDIGGGAGLPDVGGGTGFPDVGGGMGGGGGQPPT